MTKGSIGFVGGQVRTLDPRLGLCEGVLVEDGEIVVVGSTAEVSRAADERKIPTVDLGGQAVLPGPIDTHFHLVHTGLDLSAIDLGKCTSVDEVLQLVEGRVESASPKQWILGKGLDEFKIREGRPPTAKELDSVARANPVYLGDRGIHYCQLNSLAFDRIGIPVGAPGVRADTLGIATGQIMEESVGEAWRRLLQELPLEAKRKAILEGARYAAECGITALHAMEGGDFSSDEEIQLLLDMQPEMPVRVRIAWNTTDVDAVARAGLRSIGGDLWLDGSLGSRTAALSSPYADAPEEFGHLYQTFDAVEAQVRRALEAGLQIGFHAIGDRAIEQALDCFEAACGGPRLPDRACRLDHFGLPSRDQVRRAADLGVVVCTQPTFPYLRGAPGSVYAARLGEQRVARVYPLREMLDAGTLVAGGSDSNVLPADVPLGIHAAVNHPYEDQRISPEEAVRLYTVMAARCAFEEDQRGTLAPAKSGDMIVLDIDPIAAHHDRIKDARVMMTIVEGRVVFQRTS